MTAQNIYPLNRKKNLYLKMTAAKGRGVFCTSNIRKDEELEATPAIILHEGEHKNVEKTILRDYVFSIGKISKRLREKHDIKSLEDASCVIMGVASFCNHDEAPNAEVVWEERGGSLYHVLRATKNIAKDTEICTTYGDNWFEGRSIK